MFVLFTGFSGHILVVLGYILREVKMNSENIDNDPINVLRKHEVEDWKNVVVENNSYN